jgi:ribosomal protein S12 methylthiotransferase
MKLAYLNLGCPKNQVDLEIILGGLADQATLVEDVANADVMIVNTCAFIESSKRESIDAIFEVVSARQENPELKVFVSGCLPQRYKEEVAELMPEVDRFFYTVDAQQTLQQIKRHLKTPETIESTRQLLNSGHYAYLRIAEGCNNRCAYCAIPLIKGDYASRPIDDILHEAEQLASNGVKEIVVIAQDTTLYGSDLASDASLPSVLAALNKVSGVEWLRLMYTHPAHWNDKLIDALGSLDKVVPYFDVPIQHISDPILKNMGRRVTRAQIENLISKVRSRIPNVALRTSIITGFPGETQEQFQELLDYLEETRFDRLGAFTYSHEEGTRAFRLEDDISEDVKLDRQRMVMHQQEKIAEELSAAKIGEILRVLVDEVDVEQNVAIARSKWDAPEVDGNIFLPTNVLKGEFYNARIIDADIYDLKGEIE